MKPIVGILGNFQAPWCTECELAWTFNHLGFEVLKFQENEVRTQEIFATMSQIESALLVYIHTHGWSTPGSFSVEELIQKLRDAKIKTCSFHLDRYWGLNRADGREDRVGKHPFFKTDFVFTADGGNQEKFQARGVNHYWLPPAVVERDCYKGKFDPRFACDVAFVGQKTYHPEYPFRGELVNWLHHTYGLQFRHFPEGPAVRGAQLNDLYASVKVVVGDSCFAGAPYYWSDRIFETIGRGGFIIHPRTLGLDIPFLPVFEPGNLADLKEKIDYWLMFEDEREEWRTIAYYDVKKNHTYTNRVRQILSIMGIECQAQTASL